jgi:hypothetical protein
VTTTRVRELANELSQKLDDDEAIDDEARSSLLALRAQVDAALEGRPSEPPSAHAHTLIERFERDHPDLTALISRLADALSNAGL